MTDPITPTTPHESTETKLPWQAPEIQKAEINLDTADSKGSNIDGNESGSANLP